MLHKIKIVGVGCFHKERLEPSGRSLHSNYYTEAGRMRVTKLVQDAFVIQLICPICSDGCITQEMIQFGNFPEQMFCPHCEIVIPTPVPIIDSKGKHLLYIEHQAKEFIKRWKNEHN